MYIADFEDGCRLISAFVEHYNTVRLHSAIGYITPADKLYGREQLIFEQREEKLQVARQRRQALRQGTEPSSSAAH